MIHKKLIDELKEAMKTRDAVRLAVVRDLKSSFVNEVVTLGKKPDELLDDENALKVIKRKANQRKDSIEQFEKGGRTELADKERAELKILESYLPLQMSDEQIREIVLQKKTELSLNEKKDIGKLMGAVMKEVGSGADGSRVKAIIEESFTL
jgi:uncharacterized protein